MAELYINSKWFVRNEPFRILPNDMSDQRAELYINPEWFILNVSIEMFSILPNDMWVQIMSYMDISDISAWAMICHSMHKRLYYCLEMLLCEAAGATGRLMEPILPLTYIMEDKPFIDRIRVHYPDFVPFPCDHMEEKDEEPLYYESDESENYLDYEEEDLMMDSNSLQEMIWDDLNGY